MRTSKVIGGIASHPAREEFLKVTIESIIDQFDEIYVYLNNYKKVPEFLKHEKITPILSSEADGDLRALGKFYKAKDVDGYYFSMDDDIKYPKDYVSYLTNEIDLHYRKAVVGVHATIYRRHPIKSYYRDKSRQIFYCYERWNKTQSVHMLGTGTMAFHTNTLKFDWELFKDQKNMLDPQMARHLHYLSLPQITLRRNRAWIIEQKGSQDLAIWKSVAKDDSVQTDIINSIPKLQHFPAQRADRNKLGDASIEWNLLRWLVGNVKRGKVVELGAGNASREIAKNYDLTSIEHNPKWLRSHKNTILAPIVDDWYDVDKMQDIKNADVYLIDGPPARICDRGKLIENLDLFNKDAIFVLDDVNRDAEMSLAKKLSKALGRKMTVHEGQQKNFATI